MDNIRDWTTFRLVVISFGWRCFALLCMGFIVNAISLSFRLGSSNQICYACVSRMSNPATRPSMAYSVCKCLCFQVFWIFHSSILLFLFNFFSLFFRSSPLSSARPLLEDYDRTCSPLLRLCFGNEIARTTYLPFSNHPLDVTAHQSSWLTIQSSVRIFVQSRNSVILLPSSRFFRIGFFLSDTGFAVC